MIDIEKVRQSFEAAAVNAPGVTSLGRDALGCYFSDHVQGMWQGWLLHKRSLPVEVIDKDQYAPLMNGLEFLRNRNGPTAMDPFAVAIIDDAMAALRGLVGEE